MTIKDITKQFNVLLAGDNLATREIIPHLDFAVDRINETLNTVYPVVSEVYDSTDLSVQYNYFPDKYIRQVVLPGAAWHYYVTDEEGLNTAAQYKEDFDHGLYIMQRDMLYDIPEEYMADELCGTTGSVNINHWNLGYRGIETQSPQLI